MKLSYLYGLRAADWWRLLAENRFAVSPRYLHRAAAVTAASWLNAGLHRRERRVDVCRARVEAPIFIIGHWRSGTTHLQYLLSQDPQLVSPNTYEVTFPNSLLCSEATHGRFLARFVPGTRPQDGMALSMEAPNEDEIALAALGVPSLYLYLAFPRRERHYLRFLSFAEASPAERRAFQQGLDGYLRKLAWKHERTLLLKSPGHTARIGLLLDLYPDARFIHIVRDPFSVFQSTRHLHRVWDECFGFIQRRRPTSPDERILSLYAEMYDAYFCVVGRIPQGQLHTLRYEDLVARPVEQLRAIYAGLSLPGFPEGRFRRYLASLRGYRRNAYPPLDPAERALVARRWARSFAFWGYPTEVDTVGATSARRDGWTDPDVIARHPAPNSNPKPVKREMRFDCPASRRQSARAR